MTFSLASRSRLRAQDLPRFPSESLFDKLGRAVCSAGCLPRKELYEAWEVARRVRRKFRGKRVVDLACGSALTAYVLLLLDDDSPSALAVDTAIPESAERIAKALEAAWPRLAGRVTRTTARLETVALNADDLVVSVHACGALTDRVLEAAVAARAHVAVLPCCHEHDAAPLAARALHGWLDAALAIDVARAQRLIAAEYDVHTQNIPSEITPKHRLLLARPRPCPKTSA